MKVTVCELSNDWINSRTEQEALVNHLEANRSELLLLPEMPFYSWLAGTGQADPGLWEKAVRSHENWIDRLSDFNVPVIAGTRPVLRNGTPHNEAFIWTRDTGCQGIHEKYYLPDEEGFWEATWYRRGDGSFSLGRVNGMTIGFLICTELWFSKHAWEYGKQGIHLLLCPRATPTASTGTWVAGGRTAANVSGAYCLSSNFNGVNTPDINFGGTGWIIEPEEGNILGRTSGNVPFITLDIDISAAENAKQTYPRYVRD